MRPLVSLILLIATVPLSGCGSSASSPIGAAKLELTPQQVAAIKKQDEAIQNEEGGPQKVTKAGRSVR